MQCCPRPAWPKLKPRSTGASIRPARGCTARLPSAPTTSSIAEQATRAAFDHTQLREAALAAGRWLEINPTSENAHRYAGIAALKLHRLDDAEAQFGYLLDTVYISPAAGFLALLPVIGDEGVATDVMELFRRLSARHPTSAKDITRTAARPCGPTISR